MSVLNNALEPLIKGLTALYSDGIVEGRETTTGPEVAAIFFPSGQFPSKHAVNRLYKNHQASIKSKFASCHQLSGEGSVKEVLAVLDGICDLHAGFGDDGDVFDAGCTHLASICYSGSAGIAGEIKGRISDAVREYFVGKITDGGQLANEVFDREIGLLLDSLSETEERAGTLDVEALADVAEKRWLALRYLCACGIVGLEALGCQNDEIRLLEAAKETPRTVPGFWLSPSFAPASVHLQRVEVDEDGLLSTTEDFVFRSDCRQISIGTMRDNDVVIDGFRSPCVSRHHAVLERAENGWRFVHLSRTNESVIVGEDGRARSMSIPNDWERISYGSMIYLAPIMNSGNDGANRWLPNFEQGAVLQFGAL